MIGFLSGVATLLSVGGNFLLAKQNKLVFLMWIIADILWIAINFITFFNLSQVIMYLIYTGTAIYSWKNWE